MKIFCFWYLASFLLLSLGSSCFAQAMKIRVINAADGSPLPKQQVSVALLYEGGEKTPANYEPVLTGETDANGEARFPIPEPAPAHLSAHVRLTSEHWRCGCMALAVTQDVLQKGIVESAANSKKSAPIKPTPGEILFVARPESFFERLLGPLVKE
jgi:hypothetical protein